MIFPRPKLEEYFDGSYELKLYDNDFDVINFYNKYKNGNCDVTINSDVSLKSEEYILDICENGVTISVCDDCSTFRAISSLKQLVIKNGKNLPFCHIEDCPDFERRAYLFDITCGKMPTVETYCKLIDFLADLKYNEFQIYIEGIFFKYEKFPEYAKDFDCLGPEEIKFLDKYCKERFIDLVPNQNSFGHMLEWMDTEEFKHLRVGTDEINTGTINPLLDESFEFIDNLYSSLLPYFSSEYVNIGLDEAMGLGEYQLEEICKEKGADNVFMDWLNKLADHIKEKYNKKIQFWADMVYDYPDAYNRVPEGATALAWGYDLIKTSLLEHRCYNLYEKGVPYYVCPGNANWLCITGRFDVMSFNLRSLAEFGRKYGAKGYLLTDWGCGEGHNHFPVWSLVPAALAAQYSWNVGKKQNGGEFKADYIREANAYIDNTIFGGVNVSGWLYKLQQYYHFEPEKIHSATMCCYGIMKPLSQTDVQPFYDLDECGEVFYFENVIQYIKRCIEGVKPLDIDDIWKRQILINANMVLLGAELNIIRIEKKVNKTKVEELCKNIDDIYAEFSYLWDLDNYPHGKEIFLGFITDRKKELLEY